MAMAKKNSPRAVPEPSLCAGMKETVGIEWPGGGVSLAFPGLTLAPASEIVDHGGPWSCSREREREERGESLLAL
jgi:hypothetical protein